ncbi:MAG: acyl-CoA dehydrogenase [Deltaproteobacteria bacterium]
MHFALTDEQSQIREMVGTLARREFAPRAAEIDETSRFPEENLARLAELGLLGMLVPEEYGGSETGAVAYAAALSEIAYGCASTAVITAVTNMVAETVWRFGSEAQRKRFLPVLTAGRKGIGAFALTEPGAGSDAQSLSTTAVRDGEDYLLNGTKVFITNGDRAAVTVVMAVTGKREGRREISAFLVEAGTPGCSVGPREKKMGLTGSGTVSLAFDDCRVPAENLLGSPGDGFRIAMSALDGGRIGIAAQAVGIGRAAIDTATAYVRERRQFGQAVSGFQAIRWMIADAATELDAAWLMICRAAWRKEKGLSFGREASMAKLFATEAGNRACHKAVQMLGGYGYIREYPVERHLRDIKVATIYEGTSEIQRILVSRGLLGRNGG